MAFAGRGLATLGDKAAARLPKADAARLWLAGPTDKNCPGDCKVSGTSTDFRDRTTPHLTHYTTPTSEPLRDDAELSWVGLS